MAKEERKLTGVQKAAILFITLGPEASSGILKKLPESDIQKITYEIANITSVTAEQREEILNEFLQINKARDYIIEGGMDYAKQLLSKALGAQRANEILDKVSEATAQYRPFSIARKADSKQLLNVITAEQPQTIALILCYLQADKAAQVMAELPEETQSEVAYRIATMNTTSPMVIKEIESVLESKLSSVVRTEMTSLGGVETLVGILNSVDRTTEKNITEGLEREDAELADKVKSSMFVFEDVISLDDVSIQRILREVEASDLALALKGCSDEVANCIYRNQSKRAAASLKEDMEFLGPVRITDVEKAQQKIVSIIRRLDDANEIIISRGGEDESESKTIQAQGKVDRLTATVYLNKTLTQEEKQEFEDGVANAIGIDATRGDQITVSGMTFDTSSIDKAQAALEEMNAEEAANKKTMMMIAGGVIGAILLGVIIFFILKRRKKKEEEEEQLLDTLIDDTIIPKEPDAFDPIEFETKTQKSHLENEIKKYATEKPEQVVEIIKSWLTENER